MQVDPTLKEALDQWMDMSRDRATVIAYEARRKQILDELAVEREAMIRLQKAEAESRAEGRTEGREQGKAEGKAEGRVEGRAEIIRNMLLNGMEVSTIEQLIDAPRSEIDRIQASLDK